MSEPAFSCSRCGAGFHSMAAFWAHRMACRSAQAVMRCVEWLKDLVGVELERETRPEGPPHIYAEKWSSEEWWYGENQCMWCTRKDPKRRKYTNPPCPRNAGQVDA